MAAMARILLNHVPGDEPETRWAPVPSSLRRYNFIERKDGTDAPGFVAGSEKSLHNLRGGGWIKRVDLDVWSSGVQRLEGTPQEHPLEPVALDRGQMTQEVEKAEFRRRDLQPNICVCARSWVGTSPSAHQPILFSRPACARRGGVSQVTGAVLLG